MTRKPRILVMLACGALVGAAWVLPNFIKARTVISKSACLCALEMIEKEKAAWALENKKTSSDIPTEADLFGPTKYIKDRPHCPAGSAYTYTLGRIDEKPRCSCPSHVFYLACAKVVDESGAPLPGVRVEGRAASSMLRGKTDHEGFCELRFEYDPDECRDANQFVISKRGYRTETLRMPEMWPLRVTLKKAK